VCVCVCVCVYLCVCLYIFEFLARRECGRPVAVVLRIDSSVVVRNKYLNKFCYVCWLQETLAKYNFVSITLVELNVKYFVFLRLSLSLCFNVCSRIRSFVCGFEPETIFGKSPSNFPKILFPNFSKFFKKKWKKLGKNLFQK
jgi:hypothetical protein